MNCLSLFSLVSLLFLRSHASHQESHENDQTDTSCDKTDMPAYEGNIGMNDAFPWVGILRVHFHERKDLKIAGIYIVLIKNSYAMLHADVLNKIPTSNLLHETRATFQLGFKTRQVKIKGSVVHPDYYTDTLSTIAILELKLPTDNEDMLFLPKPVCLPMAKLNYTNMTYLVGLTDENVFIQRLFYKINLVDNEMCDDFYNRGSINAKAKPKHAGCGVVVNNVEHCIIDDGVPVVTRVSEVWILIGITVQGVGCKGPLRFIKIQPYLSWIARNTIQTNIYDDK